MSYRILSIGYASYDGMNTQHIGGVIKNAIHIHRSGSKLVVMILVDGIYEQYIYDNWPTVFEHHPIMLGYSKDIHIFVRG